MSEHIQFTGPMMFAAVPPVLLLMFVLERIVVVMLCGNRSTKASMGTAQTINMLFGLGWGTLFVASLHFLTGFAPKMFSPQGGGIIEHSVMITTMMVPAMALVLWEAGFVNSRQLLMLSAVTVAVMDLGVPASLQFADEDRDPAPGFHLEMALKGADDFAALANTPDAER